MCGGNLGQFALQPPLLRRLPAPLGLPWDARAGAICHDRPSLRTNLDMWPGDTTHPNELAPRRRSLPRAKLTRRFSRCRIHRAPFGEAVSSARRLIAVSDQGDGGCEARPDLPHCSASPHHATPAAPCRPKSVRDGLHARRCGPVRLPMRTFAKLRRA